MDLGQSGLYKMSCPLKDYGCEVLWTDSFPRVSDYSAAR